MQVSGQSPLTAYRFSSLVDSNYEDALVIMEGEHHITAPVLSSIVNSSPALEAERAEALQL
jgi:hypothetical protein